MHIIDFIVVAGIALALFGPKMLQAMAHSAGKTTGEVKHAKDKFMSHNDVVKVQDTLNKVPTNSQQAFHMVMSSDEQKKAEEASVDSQSVEAMSSVRTAPKNNS
jgi:Sec-independent protein translocase protein TatA